MGDRPGAAAKAARPYVDDVIREIRTTAIGGTGGPNYDGGGVQTLFFGGGTPSLCPPKLVGLLVETVRECYGIAAGAEISIEMDPGTFDEVGAWRGSWWAVADAIYPPSNITYENVAAIDLWPVRSRSDKMESTRRPVNKPLLSCRRTLPALRAACDR